MINFSNEQLDVTFEEPLLEGEYAHWERDEKKIFGADSVCKLTPWQFEIWVA
ncbi:hypothetical protein KUL17_12030 [Alteromonas sp. KUL17]|nr:hypothetical protein KUL17_12030 [Alteromonas sp. KUL17]